MEGGHGISFSITREESEQLEREYEINDILVALHKASSLVGPDKTISQAISTLSEKTRFADEVNKKCTKGYFTGLNLC